MIEALPIRRASTQMDYHVAGRLMNGVQRTKMRAMCLTIFATFFVSAAFGCQPEPDVATDAAVKAAEAEPTKPFVFIQYNRPNTLSMKPEKQSGILVAIWADGTIIRASSEQMCGQSNVRDRLSKSQLDEVRKFIDKSQVLSEESHVVPCGGATTLAVRTPREVRSVGYSSIAKAPGSFLEVKQFLMSLELANPIHVGSRPFEGRTVEWYR